MCGIENIRISFKVTGRFVHQLVYFLQGLQSQVFLAAHNRTVNAKSIIGVLSLGIDEGDFVQVSVINDNPDTLNLEIKEIVSFINRKGEE